MAIPFVGYHPPESALDTVLKGLQVAEKIYGIKTAYDKNTALEEDRALAQKQEAEDRKFQLSERERLTKERERKAANKLTAGELFEIQTSKSYVPAKEGEEGSIPYTSDETGMKGFIKQTRSPKISPPTYKDFQTRDGSIIRVNSDGTKQIVHQGKGGSGAGQKEEVYSYTDEKGNERAGKKVGGRIVQNPATDPIVKPAAFTAAGSKPSAQEKSNEDIAKKFEIQAATSLGVSNMIRSEAAKVQSFLDQGDTGQAVAAAKNMVKTLNSTFGPDAVGIEEVNRLASRLDNIRIDVLSGNYGIGPDVSGFLTQALGKAEAIAGGASENFRMADQARAGTIRTAVSPPAKTGKPESDTAIAAPTTPSIPANERAADIEKLKKELRANPKSARSNKIREILRGLGAAVEEEAPSPGVSMPPPPQ